MVRRGPKLHKLQQEMDFSTLRVSTDCAAQQLDRCVSATDMAAYVLTTRAVAVPGIHRASLLLALHPISVAHRLLPLKHVLVA